MSRVDFRLTALSSRFQTSHHRIRLNTLLFLYLTLYYFTNYLTLLFSLLLLFVCRRNFFASFSRSSASNVMPITRSCVVSASMWCVNLSKWRPKILKSTLNYYSGRALRRRTSWKAAIWMHMSRKYKRKPLLKQLWRQQESSGAVLLVSSLEHFSFNRVHYLINSLLILF